MKKILSIQDLSCVGKCGLTVALPVMSAMGHSCSVLPTALLSTHTGFPSPLIRPQTENLVPFARHWLGCGAKFDAVTVGYLSDPDQGRQVEQVLDIVNTYTIVDPVLGDHGQLYKGLNREVVKAMRSVCRKAKVLVPNLTEAAALTGLPYRETADETYLEFLLAGLLDLGVEGAVITGLRWGEGSTGFIGTSRQGGVFYYEVPLIPKVIHGTGDLFTAVTTGALMQGADLKTAATLAAQFVERTVDQTPEVTAFGVEFETQLPWLMRHMPSARKN